MSGIIQFWILWWYSQTEVKDSIMKVLIKIEIKKILHFMSTFCERCGSYQLNKHEPYLNNNTIPISKQILLKAKYN